MRPAHIFVIIILSLFCLDIGLYWQVRSQQKRVQDTAILNDIVTSGLGLTDLCLATEARYTRHPAVSDSIAPFMDQPGAIEHFPTGSFWAPPGINNHESGT